MAVAIRFQCYFRELKNMHESLIGNPGSALNYDWSLYVFAQPEYFPPANEVAGR